MEASRRVYPGGSWLVWIFKAAEAADSVDPRLDEKRREVKMD